MVYKVNTKDYTNLLKKYFKTYIYFDNPYEETYILKEKELEGIISISKIYEKIEINYILTIPKYRNQGVASKLIDYIFKNIDFESISLEVNINNEPAINLYKKYNFEIVKEIKNYYQTDNAYLMNRKK